MNNVKAFCFCFWLLIGLIGVSRAEPSTDSLASEQILKLQREFTNATSKFSRHLKAWPQQSQDTILRLLGSSSNSTVQLMFEYLINHPSTNSDPTFEDLLAQAFVIRSTDSNDLSSVTSMLAARCPECIGTDYTEWYLAYKRGPDTISILNSAYFLAGSNYSSKVLLRCFIRAFPSLRQDNMTDAEFVKACTAWTKAHQASCTLNYNYYPISGPPAQWQLDKSSSLFLTQESKTNGDTR